ncbi:MAG: 4a-hydroxytetrahydrobiopterin dehydratase [Spirochaetales bacterium]|nr:4a-hydroxytetrahydrobiopterin dehydratase [Spirochaetales bacterium]
MKMEETIPEGWQIKENALQREFVFPDFRSAFSFMTAVALLAEADNHHPDWSNSYNRVRICLTTHSEGRVSQKDFRLARKINEVSAGFLPLEN